MSRRLRIAYLPYRELRSVLARPVRQTVLSVWMRSGVPEDASIVAVHDCFEKQSFAVVLEHPSFAEVPEANMLPEHDDRMTLMGQSFLIVDQHIIPEFTDVAALERLHTAIGKRLEELK